MHFPPPSLPFCCLPLLLPLPHAKGKVPINIADYDNSLAEFVHFADSSKEMDNAASTKPKCFTRTPAVWPCTVVGRTAVWPAMSTATSNVMALVAASQNGNRACQNGICAANESGDQIYAAILSAEFSPRTSHEGFGISDCFEAAGFDN